MCCSNSHFQGCLLLWHHGLWYQVISCNVTDISVHVRYVLVLHENKILKEPHAYSIAFHTSSKSSIGNVPLMAFQKQNAEFCGYTPASAEVSLQLWAKLGTEYFQAFLHNWNTVRVWSCYRSIQESWLSVTDFEFSLCLFLWLQAWWKNIGWIAKKHLYVWYY